MNIEFSLSVDVGSCLENVNFVNFWKYSIGIIMKNAIVFAAAAMLLSVGAFAQNLKKV